MPSRSGSSSSDATATRRLANNRARDVRAAKLTDFRNNMTSMFAALEVDDDEIDGEKVELALLNLNIRKAHIYIYIGAVL